MLRFAIIIIFCLPLILLTACADLNTADNEPEEIMSITISPSQARAWMESYTDAVVVDVRSAEEFATGNIRGAVSLPLEQIDMKSHQILPDKNMLILVYCRSGIRSLTAAQQLAAMGYTRVYDFGGILDWPYGIIY